MSEQDNSPDKLAAELLKGFHTQFAENQRTREQSFLKIVGFLGAVVLGYAYVYRNLSDDAEALSYVAIASIVLLLFGCAIVTIIAYSFRRDQFVNARIRKHAQVIGPGKPFPGDYDPSHIFQKRLAMIRWMPDIFTAFFWLFPIFMMLLLVSYSTKRNLSLSFSDANTLDTLTVVISISSILISIVVLILFGSKLQARFKRWEDEFKNHPDERAGA